VRQWREGEHWEERLPELGSGAGVPLIARAQATRQKEEKAVADISRDMKLNASAIVTTNEIVDSTQLLKDNVCPNS
jgi:hypothetical protein